MKFLCDRCKTRYSIGDDRVRGKILKIRCKNCANVITVREGMTDADASAPPEGAVQRRTAKPTTLAPPAQVSASPPSNGAKPPAALEEEWYVSIDGEQSGPFSLHEAQRWVAAKAATADLHCWSEGFDDWLPVDKVSHFRGLRKKATASVPIVAPRPAPPPPPPPEDEEPKPLFAATMAALERSAAAAAPVSTRATPLGGTPAQATPMSARATPIGGTPSRSTPIGGSASLPSLPKVSNGSAAHAAIAPKPIAVPAIPMAKNATGPRPALPLPAFDASDGGDVPTQIEIPPFSDEAATAGAKPARMPTALPAPFAATSASPFGAAPAPHQPMPPVYPSAQPSPMFPAAQPSPMFPNAVAKPVAKPMPEPEPEGDIEIGEVSRVVNLADLARSSAAAKARKNGAPQRLRTTGGVSSITGGDPIAAMVATPDASYAAQSAMVPEQSAARTNNKKLYFLLGGVVLVLLIIVGAVVYVVSQNTDDDSTAIAHGREIDLSRPDDPQQHTGPSSEKPEVKDPTGPVAPHPQPHRPINNQNLGSGKTGSAVVVEEPPSTNSLKPEEVEAMARTQSEATNRCYMRAQRGADAILIGDVKRINVTLTIDREGAVTVVDLSDHATDTLGKCLQARIKGWRFHPSANGLTTRLTLVFQAS